MKGPHDGQTPRLAGAPPESARALVVLVHGRGGTAEGMLDLAAELSRPDVAFLAPQAAENSWYPNSFLAPLELNEPGLSSGLEVIDAVLAMARRAGIPGKRQLLLGFSQGACLVLEFIARRPRRLGGVVGLTGGLIGPPGSRWDDVAALQGTPVFLGSADPDPHVPWSRVEETAEALGKLGASVTLRRYPGMAHTVNADEIEAAAAMIDALRVEADGDA
jgi:predicted esterase